MRRLILTLVPIFFSLVVATHLAAMDQVRRRGIGSGEANTYQNKDGVLGQFARLNLAAEQKARIKALNEAHLSDIKPLQAHLFRLREDLEALWLQAAPNKERIMAKQKEIRAIRDRIQDQSARYRLEVFHVLTPEQQEQAKAFFVEGGAGHGLKSGMGPGTGMMGK